MRGRPVRIAWQSLLVLGSFATPAAGQALNFARLEAGENRLTAVVGLDPAVLASVEYTRAVAVGNRPLALSLGLGLPVAELDGHDYRAVLGGQMSFLRWGGFRVAGGARLISRGTSNDIFVAHGFGTDLTAYLGYYGRRGFLGVELGFDKTVVTHISHQDWYRDNFYGGAVDGWYSSPGGTWHGGGLAGISFGRFELALQGGIRVSEGGNELDPPVGGTFAATYVF